MGEHKAEVPPMGPNTLAPALAIRLYQHLIVLFVVKHKNICIIQNTHRHIHAYFLTNIKAY